MRPKPTEKTELFEPKKPRRQRQFTDAFEAGAVRLVMSGDRTVRQVAADIELSTSVLTNWLRLARVEKGLGKPGAATLSEREEFSRLRTEVKLLQQEREILKKAATFFAKESR